ncbi:MAG TPA: thioredoxin domain-containing protein [Myxococcales bacterium]|nr:thioredoxin domain-containing protein [Myxococcales bacterium]
MKSNWNVFIGVCVGAVAGFAVGQHMGSKGSGLGTPIRNAPQAAAPAAPAAPPPGSDQIFKVALGNAPQKGSPDAKVTIVEWSDFQCPFCSRVIDTLHQIEKNYGSEVRFVFKHNPLPMHPDAPYAAKASIAAQKQDKFWQMHDKLFEASASHQPDALKQDKVDAMARELGLDMEQYQRDVNAPDTAQVIRDDQAQAAKLGANGTPHFFINGARVSGAVPYESFKPVIDAQLKRANAALATGVAKKDLYETLTKDGLSGPPAPPPQAAPQPQARNVEPGSGPFIGSKKPKVTIVEWSDFQCPYCARVEPTLKQILDTYKDDVRLVWRNEPLSFHPNAMPAAKAAMAVAKQGNDKFWKMHALLFAHQTELSEAKYEEWAKKAGADVAQWRRDKESSEIADQIAKDNSYGQSVGADGTPSFFINGKFISGAMPFDTFKVVIDEQIKKADELLKKGVKQEKLYQALVDENVKAAGGSGAQAQAQPGAAGADPRFDIQVGSAPAKGPKAAPVTIVEWSDFQCPFCSRAQPTLAQIMKEYAGKVRLVWKNQPLSFHPNAMPAAEAAMAAYEQGNDKFWAMHDKLFEKQNELSPAYYERVAGEIGLDVSKWKAAVESRRSQAEIQADIVAGNAVGANGTPTFFINGRKIVGAMPFESFKAVIDAELASKVAKK